MHASKKAPRIVDLGVPALNFQPVRPDQFVHIDFSRCLQTFLLDVRRSSWGSSTCRMGLQREGRD
jgi:hypothetical protein